MARQWVDVERCSGPFLLGFAWCMVLSASPCTLCMFFPAGINITNLNNRDFECGELLTDAVLTFI